MTTASGGTGTASTATGVESSQGHANWAPIMGVGYYKDAAPGNYLASLVVRDNSGLSSAADTVTVVVQNNHAVYVANIAMNVASTKQGYQATATVTVRDHTGATKSGAAVTGAWSGLTSGTVSKTTDRRGNASLTSPRTRSTGTFTFTVTGITLSGFIYTPVRNTETSDSIATR